MKTLSCTLIAIRQGEGAELIKIYYELKTTNATNVKRTIRTEQRKQCVYGEKHFELIAPADKYSRTVSEEGLQRA